MKIPSPYYHEDYDYVCPDCESEDLYIVNETLHEIRNPENKKGGDRTIFDKNPLVRCGDCGAEYSLSVL